ncbi:MAG: zinc dependent phospholipase C family protein [Patescibacteria group bacterium]|nr:zinc dependent phospholipase C family protein [Patescibacteria group bacterium]MDD4610501.1 zinc dependent phospholipase C family protein [Patescibacteria group bacterium]
MPKENTHLFFARELEDNFFGKDIADLIKDNLDYFYLGSVFPDTFFYSKNEEYNYISDYFHGKDGNNSNEIIFEFLDKAKINYSEKDLVFVFGFITHCSLDIIMHPIIYYLSGNYYDKDVRNRKNAIYLHRHLETFLDGLLCERFYFFSLAKIKLLKNLKISEVMNEKFKIDFFQIKKTAERQFFYNKIFKSKIIFWAVYFLEKIKIFKKEELGLFYENLKVNLIKIKNPVVYEDLISGERHEEAIDKLFARAQNLAKEMILVAHKYYFNKISRKEAEKIVTGVSLDTGKINCPVDIIKFVKHC